MVSVWLTILLLGLSHFTAGLDTPPAKKNPVKSRKGVSESKSLLLEMPGVKPKTDNYYVCTSVAVPDGTNYIIHFEPKAKASIAHHVLLFGCGDTVKKPGKVWECGSVCGGWSSPTILYAWAKNAAGLDLPKDVGHRIGDKRTKYLVLQVHYAKAFSSDQQPDHTAIDIIYTPKPQAYIAGIYILMAYSASIPPQTKAYDVDVSCKYTGDQEIHPFAFRTHAHKLGRSIGGYMNNGSWYTIGEGDPQQPQAFYPTNNTVVIKPSDVLSGRCTYNTESMSTVTHIGGTDKDEMCNFYIMFYTENKAGALDYYECGGNQYKDLLTDRPDHARMRKHVVTFDKTWNPKVKLGAVSAVGTDSKGNIWIFHRGDRNWVADSFNYNNEFNTKKYGVITKNTIAQLDKNGKVLQEFGANLFYLPHGLHVDKDDNLWLTDVAMHQVFMIPAGQKKPTLTLGKKFKPGSGPNSFCKPTDVATLSTGEFFVADGYCNNRVLKYRSSKNLTLLTQWGQPALSNLDPNTGIPPPGTFNVVHSITVAEDKGLVCVADREDGRIQCFDFNGRFKAVIESAAFGTRVFAINYHKRDGGTLYAVNGPEFGRDATTVAGFTVDITTGSVLQSWGPDKGLENPHDVAVSRDGQNVYVAEIGPNKVWKFNISATKTTEGPMKLPQKKGSSAHSSGDAAKLLAAGERTKKASSFLQSEDMMPSVIIGALLVIPILIIVIVTVVIRLRKTGRLRLNKNRKNGFSLGSLLRGRGHKGFDRLSTEESDELEHLSDSEAEEYNKPGGAIQNT